MQLIRNRYRVLGTLSETLYGFVHVCSDLVAIANGADSDESRVVLKQVSLSRAMGILNAPRPKEQQAPDDPRLEKSVANALRRAGGHCNIVRYTDDFIECDNLYFVQDYCVGGDLYEHLSRGDRQGTRRLPCAEAMSLVEQVASGLAFLHEHDMAHRDLSLENVLLNDDVCQIGDFGLATRRPYDCTDRVGKAYYMAPEVVAGGKYDGKAADVWALGVMLFILLTGSPLVTNAPTATKSFQLMKTAGGIALVLEAWGIETSQWGSVVDLLSRMLEVDPTDRISVEQVLAHQAFGEFGTAVEL
ncbi:hypothetical protein BBJ28_00013907 [Nothophytophthora sp. Chile5]|nr:hypothetical protein BBJ28_00013907 [Nothophytophthora sp. Chile5]